MEEKLNNEIQKVAETLSGEMAQEKGKDDILNPKDETPIMEAVKCDEDDISSTVMKRVVNYLKKRLTSQELLKNFVDLENEANLFYEKTLSVIISMENDWIETERLGKCLPTGSMALSTVTNLAPYAGIVVATSPIWITAMIGVGAAIIGIAAAISPIAVPVWLFLNRDSKKKGLIDKYYSQYQASIKELIANELESQMIIKTKITNITEKMLPRRIQFLGKMISQLLNSREEILANQKQIIDLNTKLEVIMKSATSLKENITQI